MSFDRRRKSIMSVGRPLPGMMDLTRNASSNISVTEKTVDLLEEAAEENGCIKLEVKDEKIHGSKLFRSQVAETPWQEKLDKLAGKVDSQNPCVFVLFRKTNDILLIKYIPEGCTTRTKMLYASSMSSMKGAIHDTCPSARIEEYNTTEASELSQDEYFRQKNVEAPLSEAELQRMEDDKAETAGGYSFLARFLNGPAAIALPGMSKGPMPKALAKSFDEMDITEQPVESASSGAAEKEEETSERKSSSRRESSRKSSSRSSSSRKSSKREETLEDSSRSKKEEEEEEEKAARKERKSAARAERERKSSSSKENDRQSAGHSSSSRGKKKEKKPREEKKEPVEEEKDDGLTVAQVIRMKELGEYDDGMDKAKLELYLTNKEFKKTFGMTKDEFNGLPQWRKTILKKEKNLF